jgi:hypothetical protein
VRRIRRSPCAPISRVTFTSKLAPPERVTQPIGYVPVAGGAEPGFQVPTTIAPAVLVLLTTALPIGSLILIVGGAGRRASLLPVRWTPATSVPMLAWRHV